MKRTALYARRSTDRQEQSLDDQKAALLKFAEANGHEITVEYVELD